MNPVTNRELVLLQLMEPALPGAYTFILTGDLARMTNLPPGTKCTIVGRGAEGYGLMRGGAELAPEPQNTREQGQYIANWCAEHPLDTRITLRASAYHAYRAYLTVLKSLMDLGLDAKVRMQMDAFPHGWYTAPVFGDSTESRLALVESEFRKVDAYRAMGHVATDEDALHYMHRWR